MLQVKGQRSGVAEIIVVMHRQFSYESTGERILKAGPHLPKLLPNIKWLTFFETQNEESSGVCVTRDFC